MSLALVISICALEWIKNVSQIVKGSRGQRLLGISTKLNFDPLTLCDFLIAISATYFEICAAAAIHPNAIPVAPPCATKNTGRAAALAKQSNISPPKRAFSAPMSLLVAGLAIEGLRITTPAASIIAVTAPVVIAVSSVTAASGILAGHEFGAAAAINPDAASIKAPRPSRDARRVAALARQANAAARISAAVITPPVVRSAI
jgi:hypothetical protein